MPQTHSLGRRIFWHKIRLRPETPRHHQYATYEYEHPNRVAYAHVFRLFRRIGIVVGRWHSALDENVAAMEAVKGRVEAPDVVGEGGQTVAEHREQVYARRKAEEILSNGWVIR